MFTRRSFLTLGARAGLVLPLAALLGCDRADAPPPPPASAPAATTASGAPAPPVASPATASTRARWQRLEPSGAKPPARHDHSLTADAEGKVLYAFGGRSPAGGLSDLWVYDVTAGAWRGLQPAGAAPAGRWGHNAAFDAQRNALIVFGGQTSGGFFSDVWAYDVAGNRWERLAADNAGPNRRYGAGGVYDASARTVTITHGFTDSGRFDDTWQFALADAKWADLSPGAGERPLRRCLLRSIADPEGDRVLLFGGQSNSAPFMNDLWAFGVRGRAWTQLTTAGPSPRNLYAAVRRDDRREAFVHGGNTPNGNSGELWMLDVERATWALIASEGDAPSARRGHDLVWLHGRQVAMLFGGFADADLNDLWELTVA